MKKIFLFSILVLSLILTACQSGESKKEYLDTESSSNISVMESQTPTIEPVKENALKEYSDSVISCQYDSSILEYLAINASESILYGVVFGNDIKSDDVINGTCLYISTVGGMPDASYINNYPEVIIPTFLNSILGIDEKQYQPTINKLVDGTYEYFVELDNKTICKGKILSATDDLVTILVYRYLSDEPENYKQALDNCYDSVKLVPASSNKETGLEKQLTEANEEASKKAITAVKIEKGTLFESISAVHKNISLMETQDKSLFISLKLDNLSPEEASLEFFKLAQEICETSNLEATHSSVVFSLYVDDKYISGFNCLYYLSPDNFTSSSPLSLVDEYTVFIDNAYQDNEFFYKNDEEAKFDSSLSDLRKKYGLD